MVKNGERFILDDQDSGVKVDITIGSKEIEIDGEKARVYLLPGVPIDAGKIPKEPKTNLEELVSAIGDFAINEKEVMSRAKKIITQYRGRRIDTTSILYYACEQNKFNEFATKLEEEYSKFDHIPSDIMYARTDVTAFFHGLYMELGIGEKKDHMDFLEFEKSLTGPGLVVYPDN